MKVGAFYFGGVEMPDRGAGEPAPTDRRYGQREFWQAMERLLDTGVLAEQLGYDSFWLTEHHFQYEGYEVCPNGLMFGAILAERTERLRIGTMFNVVGQWHPLRLAEDFSILHNISGGRGILGVGRGTVPREAQALGTKIGSFDNPDNVSADEYNRAQFAEAMDVIQLALDKERFSYQGDIYQFPPPGIPDRGGFVEDMTLIPRPAHPYEIWQPVTSPPTMAAVPERGFGAVFWLQHHSFMKRMWDTYGELYEKAHDVVLEPHEKRMIVLSVRVENSREQAIDKVRPGHDEFWKFLGPYGWSRGYMGEGGRPAAPGLIPTLEESLENKTWLVGTPEDVAEGLAEYRDLFGGLENLTIFPNMLGDPYDESDEQLHRFAEQVLPLL